VSPTDRALGKGGNGGQRFERTNVLGPPESARSGSGTDLPKTKQDIVEKLAGIVRNCAAMLHLVGELAGGIAGEKALRPFDIRDPVVDDTRIDRS
jgi:hypothetical protein